MLFGIVAGSVSDAIGFKNGVSYKSVKITKQCVRADAVGRLQKDGM